MEVYLDFTVTKKQVYLFMTLQSIQTLFGNNADISFYLKNFKLYPFEYKTSFKFLHQSYG